MVSQVVPIIEPQGLHMRPAGLFARAMGDFSCTVELVVEGRHINAKSVMALIAASLKEGADAEIQCEGTDEEAALACAVTFLSTPHAGSGQGVTEAGQAAVESGQPSAGSSQN